MIDEWLTYAQRVVASEHHLTECREAGGDPAHADIPCTYRDLRYPGFFGPLYAENGILCIAWVHNARQLFMRDFLEVEKATYDWKQSGFTKSIEYIEAVQAGYVSTLPHWGPWNEFGPALKHILGNLTDEVLSSRIAYVNFAKCWTIVQRRGEKKIDPAVMRLCQAFEPIERLVEILKPSVVLVWGPSATNSFNLGLPKSEEDERVYRIHAGGVYRGWRWCKKAPKQPPSEWHELARRAYKAPRSSEFK